MNRCSRTEQEDDYKDGQKKIALPNIKLALASQCLTQIQVMSDSSKSDQLMLQAGTLYLSEDSGLTCLALEGTP